MEQLDPFNYLTVPGTFGTEVAQDPMGALSLDEFVRQEMAYSLTPIAQVREALRYPLPPPLEPPVLDFSLKGSFRWTP